MPGICFGRESPMKCNSCGYENPDNINKGESCGCEMNVKEKKPEGRLGRYTRYLFGKGTGESLAAIIVPICAVLLIAATLFLIVSSFVEISDEPRIEDHYVTFYDEKKDVTYFLFKGKLVDGFVYGRCDDPYAHGSISADGTVAAVVCRRGGDAESGGDTLSLITPGGIKMISDRVTVGECDFTVSEDGKFVAYTLSRPGALYICDTDSGKSEIVVGERVGELDFVKDCRSIACVTEDGTLKMIPIGSEKEGVTIEGVKSYAVLDDGARVVYTDNNDSLFLYTDWSSSTDKLAENVISFCVSSDFMTFAYTVAEDGSELSESGMQINSRSFFRDGPKDVELSVNITVHALDAQGKYIYATDESGALLLLDRGGNQLRVSEERCEYYISKDMTEVLCAESGGTFLFSRDCGKVMISGLAVTPMLLPEEEKAESFSERFYTEEDAQGDKNVFYVNSKLERLPVLDGVSTEVLSKDGKRVFAEKDGSIFVSELGKEASLVCEGVLSEGEYHTSDTKSALYLEEMNGDGESYSLYWCEGGEKTLVSDRGTGDVYMSHDGYLFFTEGYLPEGGDGDSDGGGIFSVDGEKGYPLYCVKNGGEKVHVTDNMCRIRISKSSAYIITPSESFDPETNPTFSVYGGVRGSNFKLLIEEITIYKK